jgi:hypothetical protein
MQQPRNTIGWLLNDAPAGADMLLIEKALLFAIGFLPFLYLGCTGKRLHKPVH